MARKVSLDHGGIAEILKSREMQALIREAGNEVADNVNAQGLTAASGAEQSGTEIRAEVEFDITDRARATVVVKHPAADAMQARHGMLTKGAAQAGLTAKDKR